MAANDDDGILFAFEAFEVVVVAKDASLLLLFAVVVVEGYG